MPNSLSASGLTVATQSELNALLILGYQAIYGADIDTDPETPDGQQIGLTTQIALDLEDLLVQINNSFDPDNAIGVLLDQRCAINGVQRQAGSYSVTNITLINSQSVNLYGLDQSAQPVYTISDNAGNQWQLQTTQLGLSSGTHTLSFQAANPGAVQAIPNTITNFVTVVLGVTSVNNPTGLTTLGTNEESDFALRIRRQKSVSLSSQGYLAGLEAALLNIPGVTFALVDENNTGTTNGDGVPGHSIWVIVAGSGAAADIANAIYTKRNAGCGIYNSGDSGAQSYVITQVDGSTFTVYWDDVIEIPLFIQFTAQSLNKINPPNIAAIQSGLNALFIPGVSSEVNINQLATYVQAIDPNTLVTSAGFSLSAGGSYTNTLTPAAKNNQFQILSSDIIILSMILAGGTGTNGIGYTFDANGNVTGTTLSVAAGGTTFQFQGLGGYGTLTYSKLSGNGSINSSTGLYTSGTAGTDILQVTDSQSHTATCTVTVS